MKTASAQRDRTTLGIIFMLVAVLMFALNDVMGKQLVGVYTVGQVLFFRSAAAVAVLLAIIAVNGWRTLFTVSNPKLMLVRTILVGFEVASFYFAVRYMPLADTITFWMASPIYVAALSPLLLGERVGWRRWTAIVVGFVGVLIALRPSSETLTLPAFVAIFGSLCFGLMMISGRALRQSSDVAMVFWPIATTGLACSFFLPFAGEMPTPGHLSMMALLGIVALVAHVFTNRSLRLADAATVTPYQYTLLVWAMIFGWFFFDETPRLTTLVGAAFIVASGMFIFFREQKLGIKREVPTDIT